MQEKEREISIIKERILKYLNYKSISKYECYQKTGISRSVLSQSNGMTEDNLLKFLAVYKDVSYAWLLNGEGEMIKSDNTIAIKSTDPCIGIPLIPIEVVAGWNGIDSLGVVVSGLDHYIIPEFIAAGAEYLIRVSGSSMYPKYSNGDVLACRRVREITFFQWNKVYVLDTAQGALIKRVKKGSDTNHITCISDNINYEPFELPKSEIRSLSIVIGVVRLE